MNINTKFNIGDKVYPIEYSDIYPEVKCTFCDGKGDMKINGNNGDILEVKCPRCHGNKELVKQDIKEWNILDPIKIKTITVIIDEVLPYIEYDSISEEDLFTTKQQATSTGRMQ